LGVLDPGGFFDERPRKERTRPTVEETAGRMEAGRRRRAARVLVPGDLVRTRGTWRLAIIESVGTDPCWPYQPEYVLAVEAPGGVTTERYGRDFIVPAERWDE